VEATRQPIYVVLLLAAAALLVVNPSLSAYTMDDDNKILVDMGLSTLFLAGLLLSAFTATGVLSAEVENRTVLTVVSKPVSRPAFVTGKYLGVAAALAVAFWTLTLIFLLTVRHEVIQRATDPFDMPVIVFGVLACLSALLGATLANYFYHWVFTSTFVFSFAGLMTVSLVLVLMINKEWAFQSIATDLDPQLMTALLLVFEAVLILTAVAVACSTRLGQVMTLVTCALVFLLGLVTHYFSMQADRTLGDLEGSPFHHGLYWLLKLFFLLVPNLQYLWHADALTQDHPITGQHVFLLSVYSTCYIAAILSLAIALFQTREVG
jgi:ABC-type transport system involved in multi-copper enzyme maturation permease subunit